MQGNPTAIACRCWFKMIKSMNADILRHCGYTVLVFAGERDLKFPGIGISIFRIHYVAALSVTKIPLEFFTVNRFVVQRNFIEHFIKFKVGQWRVEIGWQQVCKRHRNAVIIVSGHIFKCSVEIQIHFQMIFSFEIGTGHVLLKLALGERRIPQTYFVNFISQIMIIIVFNSWSQL